MSQSSPPRHWALPQPRQPARSRRPTRRHRPLAAHPVREWRRGPSATSGGMGVGAIRRTYHTVGRATARPQAIPPALVTTATDLLSMVASGRQTSRSAALPMHVPHPADAGPVRRAARSLCTLLRPRPDGGRPGNPVRLGRCRLGALRAHQRPLGARPGRRRPGRARAGADAPGGSLSDRFPRAISAYSPTPCWHWPRSAWRWCRGCGHRSS